MGHDPKALFDWFGIGTRGLSRLHRSDTDAYPLKGSASGKSL
jgi:hypothetical protein